jgi:peroxiredoxin
MPEIIKENEYAADFTLKDQNDEKYNLSDFENQKILLSFHPFAWTVVCAKHMQLLENNYK